MYKIYADDKLIYHPYIEKLNLQNAVVNLEQNGIGTFKFTLQSNHPFINSIQKRKTTITVLRDDELLFHGIVLTDDLTFKNAKTFQCKEYPYFLTYSIQRPYSFTGSPEDFLKMIIENHNSQVSQEHQFQIGEVTVADANDTVVRADSTYMNTWETIQKKLIDVLGGYIRFRYVKGVPYIDYLKEFTTRNSQVVNFGENLLDLSQNEDALDLFTVLIPQGATIEDSAGVAGTEKRVDITSVNDGKDFVQDDSAVAKYGRIEKTIIWDDVTEPSNLFVKAKRTMLTGSRQIHSIELKAVDLGNINKNIEWFHMGNYIKVISKKNNVDDYFLPMQMQINLFNVSQNSITLNSSKSSLTDLQIVSDANTKQQLIDLKKEYTDKLSNYPTKVQVTSEIKQTADSIQTIVSKKVGKNEVISSINQSAEEIAIDADKINLNGAVTANGYFKIGTDGKVDIINGEIRMGDITGDGIQTTLNPKGLLAQTKSGKVVNITGTSNTWSSPLIVYDVNADGSKNFSNPYSAISNDYIDIDNWYESPSASGKIRLDKTGSQPKLYIYSIRKEDNSGYYTNKGSLNMGYYGFDTWDLVGVNSRYTAGYASIADKKIVLTTTTKYPYISLTKLANGSYANTAEVRNNGLIAWDSNKQASSYQSGFLYVAAEDSTNCYFYCQPNRSDGGYEVIAHALNTYIGGNLYVDGTKNRVVKTEHFGDVLQNALETPVPTFADYGEGQLDETGNCRIYLDEKFLETVDDTTLMNVFLTKYGSGDIFVKERTSEYFDVQGTAGLKFGWQVMMTQRGYNSHRLEELKQSVEPAVTKEDNELKDIGYDFITEYEEGLVS